MKKFYKSDFFQEQLISLPIALSAFHPCVEDMSKYTAISRKVVGKSARDNLESYCGWFWVRCFSKKFQRMRPEAMEICLRELKESNKSRFDSYSVRKSALLISHITFRDCRMHSFSDNLSRNGCIKMRLSIARVVAFTDWSVDILACLRLKVNFSLFITDYRHLKRKGHFFSKKYLNFPLVRIFPAR